MTTAQRVTGPLTAAFEEISVAVLPNVYSYVAVEVFQGNFWVILMSSRRQQCCGCSRHGAQLSASTCPSRLWLYRVGLSNGVHVVPPLCSTLHALVMRRVLLWRKYKEWSILKKVFEWHRPIYKWSISFWKLQKDLVKPPLDLSHLKSCRLCFFVFRLPVDQVVEAKVVELWRLQNDWGSKTNLMKTAGLFSIIFYPTCTILLVTPLIPQIFDWSTVGKSRKCTLFMCERGTSAGTWSLQTACYNNRFNQYFLIQKVPIVFDFRLDQIRDTVGVRTILFALLFVFNFLRELCESLLLRADQGSW